MIRWYWCCKITVRMDGFGYMKILTVIQLIKLAYQDESKPTSSFSNIWRMHVPPKVQLLTSKASNKTELAKKGGYN